MKEVMFGLVIAVSLFHSYGMEPEERLSGAHEELREVEDDKSGFKSESSHVDGTRDQEIRYPEALQFFEGIKGYGERKQWVKGNAEQVSITLDFDGRRKFNESVRSDEDSEHVNSFLVTVPISEPTGLCCSFALRNVPNPQTGKYYSTTYGFSAVNDWNWMPYLYDAERRKRGILDDFVSSAPNSLGAGCISCFAINVLRILKWSTKPLTIENLSETGRIRYLNAAIEIAAMILTTERARHEYSPLISYIEFYKLKHTCRNSQREVLLSMFNRDDPVLKFPKAHGGVYSIQEMQPEEIYEKFIEMLRYSPYYEELQKLPESMHAVLEDLFYEGKLERLRAIHENRNPGKTSDFKRLVDASVEFFKLKMKRIIKAWRATLADRPKEVSDPELVILLDPYADQFDEYDESPLNPTKPGHHDHLFRE